MPRVQPSPSTTPSTSTSPAAVPSPPASKQLVSDRRLMSPVKSRLALTRRECGTHMDADVHPLGRRRSQREHWDGSSGLDGK